MSYNGLPFEIKLLIMELNSDTFLSMMCADLMLMKYVSTKKQYYTNRYLKYRTIVNLYGDIITYSYISDRLSIYHGKYNVKFRHPQRKRTNYHEFSYDEVVRNYNLGLEMGSSYFLSGFHICDIQKINAK